MQLKVGKMRTNQWWPRQGQEIIEIRAEINETEMKKTIKRHKCSFLRSWHQEWKILDLSNQKKKKEDPNWLN